MSWTLWVLIAVTALMTAAVKAVGPLALGGCELPGWFTRVVVLLAPALLCALVVTGTFADGRQLTVGANAVGVAAAGVVYLRRGSVIAGVLVAVVVTTGVRTLG